MTKKKIAIGIDLGTSKCCVAVVRPNGKAEVIENERGNKTTPSYVAFTDEERLVGEAAKDRLTFNPANTVYGVKRLMGLNCSDIGNFPDKYCSYSVMNEQNKPVISVSYRNEDITLTPEQISAMLLKKMKVVAEKHLGCTVEDAVISVPAHFNNEQRQATKTAAALAGLNVLSLINEPTAAGIAYIQDKVFDADENILIFDFGGGFLEVSHLKVSNMLVEVLGFNHETFGGTELNFNLFEILKKRCQKKFNEHIATSPGSVEWGKIQMASEKAKHDLSLLPNAFVNIPSLYKDKDFVETVYRKELEEKMEKFVGENLHEILRVPENSASLQEIVLIGGSSRIPFIQQALRSHFSGSNLNKTVNMNEGVAIGAAIAAHIYNSVSPSYKIIENYGQRYEDIDDDIDPKNIEILGKKLQEFEKHDKELEDFVLLISNLETRCFELQKFYSKQLTGESKFIDELLNKCHEILDSIDDEKIISSADINSYHAQLEVLLLKVHEESTSNDDTPYGHDNPHFIPDIANVSPTSTFEANKTNHSMEDSDHKNFPRSKEAISPQDHSNGSSDVNTRRSPDAQSYNPHRSSSVIKVDGTNRPNNDNNLPSNAPNNQSKSETDSNINSNADSQPWYKIFLCGCQSRQRLLE